MDGLRIIEDFPDYGVSREGEIYNIATEHRRVPSVTKSGSYKITLFHNGVGHTRSVAKIVADAWLYNDFDPEIFDTPIHLDNDLRNNHVDNLAWRPRWFALRYQIQYWNEEYRLNRTAVEDIRTGEIYESIMGPCQRYGLLFIDVIKSCTEGLEVFPTWKKFRFAG